MHVISVKDIAYSDLNIGFIEQEQVYCEHEKSACFENSFGSELV